MDYQASSKYIRTSPRKLRLVADSVRKLQLSDALVKLSVMSKDAAEPLVKVIKSAIANAKGKQANVDNLQFKAIEIMGGSVMKRWHAVSKGQAHPYKKRLSHARVILTDNQNIESKQVGKNKT